MMNQMPGTLTGYDCPRCLNRGGSYKLENGYITFVQCSCEAIRRSIRRAKKSGLGDLLERHTFERFQTPEPWQATGACRRRIRGVGDGGRKTDGDRPGTDAGGRKDTSDCWQHPAQNRNHGGGETLRLSSMA